MKKSLLKKFELVSLVVGVALFAYLIKQTGTEALAHYFRLMGWGFAFILALSAVRNCARAGSWYFSIEPEHRSIRYRTLMNVMLAGEAIKYLTATGPLLGEPAKAAMVRRQVPLLYGFSSVMIENLIYYLSVFLFMLMGLPALAWLVTVPGQMKTAGYIIGAVIILGLAIVWLAMRSRWYVFSRAFHRLSRRAALNSSDRLTSLATRTRELEENVYSFYERRRIAFYLILAFNIAAHLINVVEVYVILLLMGLPASLSAGFVIEAVTKVINLAFFFVPTRAGVYESGNALTLSALGMSAGAGVALAIIRKIRAFVWVGYGLAVIAIITVRDRRAAASPASAQEACGSQTNSEFGLSNESDKI